MGKVAEAAEHIRKALGARRAAEDALRELSDAELAELRERLDSGEDSGESGDGASETR